MKWPVVPLISCVKSIIIYLTLNGGRCLFRRPARKHVLYEYSMLYANGCLRTIYGMGRGLFFR